MALQIQDTHESFKLLVSKGFTDEQAEGIVKSISTINTSGLATKDDINGLRTELKNDITVLKEKIDAVKIWFIGAMLTQTLALVALMKF